MILHAYDASSKGIGDLSILTVDTDVVIISLYHFYSSNLKELCIQIGVGQHRIWLPVHLYANLLKEEVCHALPF